MAHGWQQQEARPTGHSADTWAQGFRTRSWAGIPVLPPIKSPSDQPSTLDLLVRPSC